MTLEVHEMPTIRFRFPGGRYHATAWGHHVNEGLVEWPPSPWRLLRALIASGFARHQWSDLSPLARTLIEKLSGVLPNYEVPPISIAHSRHFMPLGSLSKGREQTTLILDAWGNVGAGELLVHWPCELEEVETDLLQQLAASLGYLGRSESWVEAELITAEERSWNAVPCFESDHRGPGWEQVSLMAPIPALQYEESRKSSVQEELRGFENKKMTTALRKKREQAIVPFPPDLSSCLTKDTAWWRGHGWSQPPGSRRVLYWRRHDALQAEASIPLSRSAERSVSCMLLAISTLAGNPASLPPITRTLPHASLIHRSVVSRVGQGERVDCPELTGKNEIGRPLDHHHEHAHTLPIDLDEDGLLDHVLIFAPMGLRDRAQQAIRSLRRTWNKSGVGDFQVTLVASGDLDLLRELPAPLSDRFEKLLGPIQGARVWESVTPFVPPRFLKSRGKNAIEGQVNSELASRLLPAAEQIEVDPELTRSLRHFVRVRGGRAVAPPRDLGLGLRLVFGEAIRGPVLLGYASHYGLGMFRASEKSELT